MGLKKFSDGEIALSAQEAWEVLNWFFTGGASLGPGGLTANDRSFAQALLVEAVDRSEQIGWIQSLWSATANPSTSVKAVLAKLALKAAKDWLKSGKPTNFRDAKIYTMVKNQLILNWRSAWLIRVETNEPVY